MPKNSRTNTTIPASSVHTQKHFYTVDTATGREEFGFTTTFASAMLTHDSSPLTRAKTDVYDSGTSSHMSPVPNQFTSLTTIMPKPIKATDQTQNQHTNPHTSLHNPNLHMLIPWTMKLLMRLWLRQ